MQSTHTWVEKDTCHLWSLGYEQGTVSSRDKCDPAPDPDRQGRNYKTRSAAWGAVGQELESGCEAHCRPRSSAGAGPWTQDQRGQHCTAR